LLKWLSLPPFTKKKITLLLSTLRQWRPKTIQCSGHGGNNDTIDGSKSNQQSTRNNLTFPHDEVFGHLQKSAEK
jgi:hypothetical protein